MILLDANASVPPLPSARDALVRALDVAGNPSSPHAPGRAARRILDEARDQVAQACAASSKDVFFTSGASEGNRLIVDMLIEAGHRRGKPFVVVTSPLEHPSIHKPLERAAARQQIELRTLKIKDEAVVVVDPAIFQNADALLITAAHNETGLLIDLAALCEQAGDGVVVVVDAAQSLGRIGAPPDRADAIVCSAHKLGGFAGAGAVVLRRRARALPPPWTGGGQENGLRPGTEATSLIAAFGAACAVVDDTRRRHGLLAPLRDRLEAKVIEACGGRAVCSGHARLPNTSAVLFPDVDGDALRLWLDQSGVAVGFGAACSALAPEPSPGLVALGLSVEDTRRVVRLSLSPGTSEADVDDAAERIAVVARKLR
ncbi:MAG: aminotransferase class V-fold PLP-dependent enzyme [Deltaproteobacteria bacterium]|nr:aminotransferase class V-fold PLP-dependent enzyme [Deltaproteobacteria bacterium]